ncbi:MAG: AMP-binding protein, partial [Xanthobacteraceae bacterium]
MAYALAQRAWILFVHAFSGRITHDAIDAFAGGHMTLTTPGEAPPAGTAGTDPIWFASYPAGVPATIDPDIYPSLPAMLIEACRQHAPRPAFECLGAQMTYAQWERDSRDFAAFLVEEAGCRRGDRVAIMLPNMLAYPVTFLGALRAGMTVVNVNPLYTPRE